MRRPHSGTAPPPGRGRRRPRRRARWRPERLPVAPAPSHTPTTGTEGLRAGSTATPRVLREAGRLAMSCLTSGGDLPSCPASILAQNGCQSRGSFPCRGSWLAADFRACSGFPNPQATVGIAASQRRTAPLPAPSGENRPESSVVPRNFAADRSGIHSKIA